ncbi:MAG: bifunctional UDP-sugar hydrolase/5'-nucleotidase [Synergistaceae bacterium]|nr:bifunctional UDP-sugar hydrolase/5'-nucleotidase [Synergistaceae bacterium]
MKFQKKVVLAVALLAFFVSPALAVNVQFLSTNDMHSRLYSEKNAKTQEISSGFAKLRTAIDIAKKAYKGDTLVCSGGDYTEGFFYYYFKGIPEATASNMVGYDITTVGNHEFDAGGEDFIKFLNIIKYPMISSNLTFKDPSLNKRVKRTHIIKTKGGVKVGFVGLTTTELAATSHICETGFVTVEQDTTKVAQAAVDELKKKGCDMIIVLSHLGHETEILLAQRVRGINAIIGGHTHTKVEELMSRKDPDGNDVIITQTGCYVENMGKLDLCVENGKTVLAKSKWKLEPLGAKYKENEKIVKYLAPFKAELEKKLGVTISTCLDPINLGKTWTRSNESPIGSMIADAMREGAKTDIAIQHAGGIRGGLTLEPGPVSALTMNTILPFGNNVCVTELTGEELKQVMEVAASAYVYEGDGFDGQFRTPGGGFMQISGMRVTYDMSKKPALVDNKNNVKFPGERVVKLEILQGNNFVPVDPKATYKVASTDWTASAADKYYPFAGKKPVNTATTNKEFFIQKLTKIGKEFKLPKQDRMIFLKK